MDIELCQWVVPSFRGWASRWTVRLDLFGDEQHAVKEHVHALNSTLRLSCLPPEPMGS